MEIIFDLALFSKHPETKIGNRLTGLPRKESEKVLLFALEALVNIDRIEIRKKRLPPLYKAGVRYVREEDTEVWQDAITILRNREGDCEDLACYRIAELRNNGKKVQPYIRYKVGKDGYIYHVMVLRANGTLEDPSRILGMGRK